MSNVYVASRDTNRLFLYAMDNGLIPYDEKVVQYVANNWYNDEREIGCFETLQEAIDSISNDVDLNEQRGVPKQGLWYGIVIRHLGSGGYADYDTLENKNVNGVLCTVFRKQGAD